MKKISISILSGVVMLLLGATVAHAAASLNSPGAMPTLTITNATTNPCNAGPIDGCWKTSTTARPGDVIAVHVYYENTGNDVARATTLSIKPGTTGVVSSQTFTGGVASTTAPRSVGNASVSINGSASIEYMSGTARWYPSASSAPRAADDSLFGSSGFYIGDIYPGEQGVLVANFAIVGGSTPAPQDYQCDDGIDNDGDGRTDYPSDPGCSSPSDDNEYNSNPTPSDDCTIDSFTASDYSIEDGDSTTLRWNTSSDCDYVSISSIGTQFSADGSTTVSPSSDRTYTLTAYPGGDTARVTIAVDDNNNNNDDCQIDSFKADDSSLDDGDSTKLRWNTSGCDYVNISSVDNGLSEDGSVTVRPSSDRTYTLTAYPGGDTAKVTVRVNDNNNDECTIDSFSADDYSLSRNDSTKLRWSTTGASDIDITPSYSNRSADGSVSVSPSSTTTYTIRVSGSGCSDSESLTIVVNGSTNSKPQAITTAATALGVNAAQLNGIAVPNTTSGSTTAWFEYGPGTTLGSRTSARSIGSGNSTFPYSDAVSGLAPNVEYYYRAAVQNQNGTAYGDIVRIPRPVYSVASNTTVVTTRPTVSVQSTRVSDLVVAKSTPSLLELRVESVYDRMCIGGDMDYTITYRNISNTRLDDAVLQVQLPKELTYVTGSRGNYDAQLRTLTIDIGTIQAGEQGTVTVRAKVNELAIRGNLTVMTATVVYTNSETRAQEDAIAYSLVTVSDDCPNLLGASVFGFGSFLPDTLLEWLLLILVILALVVLGRNLYKKKEPVKAA